MVDKKYFGVLAVVLALVFVSFVSATTTLNSLVAGGNYSTTISVNCTTNLAQAINASLWYNASGGAVGTLLTGSELSGAIGTTEFYNSSVSVSSLTSAATYNFSCKIQNFTGSEFSPGKVVTIDNNGSTVNFGTLTETNADNVSRANININISATDALTGVKNITIRLYNGSSALLFTNVSTINPFYINYTGLADGVYYYNASATDYANNINSSS